MGKPTPRDIEKCESGEELSRELAKIPGVTFVRCQGSHEIWKLPDGTMLVNPRHRQPFGKGLRRALTKSILPFVSIIILALLYWANFA